MTEAPYPPLRPQRPIRRGTRARIPWPMVVGVVLLAVLATALVLVLLGGDVDPDVGAASDEPSASTSPSPNPSTSADVPSPSASTSSTTSPDLASIAHDSVVETTVERLSLRGGPSTDAERLGSLALGTVAFVVDGPVEADGFTWYQVSGLGLPPNSGCAFPETEPINCPAWFGWVAGHAPNGDPWLASHALECPQAPLDAETVILGRSNIERLACFGADRFTFRAFWPKIPDDAGLGGACTADSEPSGWLLCQNINYNYIASAESADFGIGVTVSIDPTSGVAMPPRGTWIELTAHLDDPAAQACDEAAQSAGWTDYDPAAVVLGCRAELVVEAVQPVAGP